MSKQNSTVKVNNNIPSFKSDITEFRANMAAALKAERANQNLTQISFAQLAGVTKQSQIAYENGSRAPDSDYWFNVFKTMGIDVGRIITGVDSHVSLGVSDKEAELLKRYREMPIKVRKTVEDLILLCHLASSDRKGY
jgi:transcriptional regulator with XRE-family HTH domain